MGRINPLNSMHPSLFIACHVPFDGAQTHAQRLGQVLISGDSPLFPGFPEQALQAMAAAGDFVGDAFVFGGERCPQRIHPFVGVQCPSAGRVFFRQVDDHLFALAVYI